MPRSGPARQPDGIDGSEVEKYVRDGRIIEVAAYCETDVVNTYLVFLRFQQMREALTPEQHRSECELVKSTLAASTEPHWKEFLARWRAA